MSNPSRRTFLKSTGALVAAACAGAGPLAAKSVNFPVGLQLYSVRELLAKDFDGTLAKLKTAGIQEVEAAGYYNRTAVQFRKSIDNAGMRIVSTHHPLTALLGHEDELIEYGHNLGLEYIVCPGLRRRDPAAQGELKLDDYHWACGELNRIGAMVKKAGMTFGYHNHEAEFASENGVVFYDEMLKLCDPKLVIFEMDCGWVYAGGADPVAYLKKTPARFPLLHIKDMVKGADGVVHSPVMGKGKVNNVAIMRAATGLKHYFLEQEEFDGIEPIEAVRQDAEYMKHLQV
jgi:sugar phosphate isomerase/epimerase